MPTLVKKYNNNNNHIIIIIIIIIFSHKEIGEISHVYL